MFSYRYLTTTVLSVSLFVLPAEALSDQQARVPQLFLAQAQPTASEVAIDRAFKLGSLPPGTDAQTRSLVAGIRSWMGAYQGLRKEGNDYLVMFERGQLPVSVRQNARGQINSVSFGCPRSRTLNLSQASKELRQVLSSCPNLKN